MILFFYGKDSFRSKQQIKRAVEKFKKERDPQGFNTTIVNCDSTITGSLREMITTPPFLSEKKMVVIEKLLASKQKEQQEQVFDLIERGQLSSDTVLIFWEETDTYKSKKINEYFERLTKEKYAQKFDALEGAKLYGWIQEEVRERGAKIDKDATTYLGAQIGHDMWALSGTIDQLISYAQNRTITIEDIYKFVSTKEQDNIFALIDAITKKKTDTAFSLLQEQYAIGSDAQYIFAMIIRQVKLLLQIKNMEDLGHGNASELAKQLGQHPFVIKKTLPLVKGYTMNDLRALHRRLIDMDIQSKTGQADLETTIDMFISHAVK